jgi:hypothetical protein
MEMPGQPIQPDPMLARQMAMLKPPTPQGLMLVQRTETLKQPTLRGPTLRHQTQQGQTLVLPGLAMRKLVLPLRRTQITTQQVHRFPTPQLVLSVQILLARQEMGMETDGNDDLRYIDLLAVWFVARRIKTLSLSVFDTIN